MFYLKNLLFFSAFSILLMTENSFAASHFLPNYEDHLASYRSTELDFSTGKTDECADYPIAKCPKFGSCSKCSFGNLFRLDKCLGGYKIANNFCIAQDCNLINSAYRADVPSDQVCIIAETNGVTCYRNCQAINCAAYPLTLCPNNANCSTCPDCTNSASTKGNCSVPSLKISSCKNANQKINANATACVDKDDACPMSYYKTCDTGIEPSATIEYTELGTACYQCKARTCSDGRFNVDNYWCDSALRCLLK